MGFSRPRGSAVDVRTHRRVGTHGKLRKISRRFGTRQPKAVHTFSSFKQEALVRPDKGSSCKQPFGSAGEFIRGALRSE